MEGTNAHKEVAAPKRPLLQTKLVMPRQRRSALERVRLLDRLNAAIGPNGHIFPKLTLISGPAGYGKSTLAVQWVTQLQYPVAWLSLDASDNDEARFLAYLFAAVGTVHEEVGESALSRLTSTYVHNDTESILTAFLNDLATAEQPLVLVMDDYHLIQTDAIHQAMSFVLQHMPVQLHVVITSRVDPPLSLSLLRARDGLNHITQRDLRFTPDEAAGFLEKTMGLALTSEQITQLDEQVEGWVTGYQLIALALKEEVVLQEAFSGNQRYLVDYLGDQVLDRQPEAIQSFLLDTAVLSQFNADLCRHVSGADQADLLRQVEQRNLFLIPLDAARNWFRYHHLFGDFLNGRLGRLRDPGQIADQHRRAAEWLAEDGQTLIALEHALAARDYDMATELMMGVARDVLMYGEGNTLRQWIESLPTEWQTSRRRLQLFYAWSLIRTGDFGRASAVLDEISDQLDTALLWGEWSALKARLAVMTGDVDVNIQFSQKALHKLPLDQHMLRSEVAINLGFSMLQQAELEAAREAFAEAAQNTAHDPGLWSVMYATFHWAITHERVGQLEQAFEIYQRGLATAEARVRGGDPSPAVGYMHVGMGKLLYQWNRLAESEVHFRQALRFAERCGDYKMLIYTREGLADLLGAMGAWDEAEAIIQDLERHVQADGVTMRRATLAQRRGDLSVLARWADRLGIALEDSLERVVEMPVAYLALVRLHLCQQSFEGVDRLLGILADLGEEKRSLSFSIRVMIIRAISMAKQGFVDPAVSVLQHALLLAQPGGYVRLFLDELDPSLIRLLHIASANGVASDYARQILAHLEPGLPVDSPAVQPLSPRELEVLQHLAAGRTNRQIAAEMVVSLNTIKAHTRRLYDKLNVRNRTEAVARGRELSLL